MISRKPKGFVFDGMARLAIILFILTMAFALIDTVWAVYLESFVQSASMVGFISAFLTLVSFFSFFFTIPIIQKSKKTSLFSFSLIMIFFSYLLFAINTKFYFMIILSVIVTVLHTLRITCFGILIKEKSTKSELSKNEGLMYTFMNIAWLLGPLIAGFLSEKYGISLIFILSAIFIIVSLLAFKISGVKDPGVIDHQLSNVWANFFDFFKDRKRVLAYFIGGGVSFWWSLIYLFVPVYMIESGLQVKWIGYFLFAVAIPLILFSYKFSQLAGRFGFRLIFKIGFFIPFFFCLLCFFVPNLYLMMLFLIFASLGLAMLEAPAEAYFFDILREKEELKFYGPYNTTIDVNHFIGRIFSAIILIFLPFRYVFLFFALAMFFFFLLSFRVKNIVESKRK